MSDISYTLGGSGSSAPPEGRQHIDPRNVRDTLMNFCMAYLDENLHHKSFNEMKARTAALPGKIDDIHAIITYPWIEEHDNFRLLGGLLSAFYSSHPEPYVVYDLETPNILDLAQFSSGIFINKGRVGALCANSFEGLAVNLGTTDQSFAYGSHHVAINLGKIDHHAFASGASFGIDAGPHRDEEHPKRALGSMRLVMNNGWDGAVIVAQHPDALAASRKSPPFYLDYERSWHAVTERYLARIENLRQYLCPKHNENHLIALIPAARLPDAFKAYVDELLQVVRAPERIIPRYGADPCGRIKADIADILGGA